MKAQRKLLAGGLLIATIVGFGLTACSTPAAKPSGPVSITMVGADPKENFAPLITAFEKKYPKITVNYQNVPFDQYNNVIQQRVGGKDPSVDVFLADSGAVGSLAEKGYLKDLTADEAAAKKSSLPAAVTGVIYKGKMWALPMWTSLQYLYYNKALLDAANIPYPSSDPSKRETWEDLAANGAKAQKSGAEYGLLFDQTDRYYQLQALSESAGGGSGAAGPKLLKADITNPGWIKAMTWYGDLFANGIAPRGITTDQMGTLFAGGKSAYFVSGPWSLDAIKQAKTPISFGVAANPIFKGGTPAMPTGSWNIGISTATDQPDAAKKFVEFASLSAEGNAAAAGKVIIPGTNLTAFDNYVKKIDTIDAPGTTGMGALSLEELKNAAVNRPNSPGFVQLQDVLGRAYSDIRNGQPVQSTLDSAQKELQGLWDRL